MSDVSPNSMTQEALNEAIKQAKSKGFIVLQSSDKLLLLDLDSDGQFEGFRKLLPKFRDLFHIGEGWWWASMSNTYFNPRYHVSLELEKPLPVLTRYALQAVFRSDPVKEAISLRRALDGVIEPSLLFRPAKAVLYSLK